MDRSSVAALRTSHLGKILGNIAILGAVLCVASAAYFLLVAFYYMILLIILLSTLFIILVYYPDFMDLFTNAEKINEAVANFSAVYLPKIAPITLVVAAAAIVLMALSRQKNTARITLAAICLVVAAVTVILTYAGGNSQ